ncbi:O-antigen ligase family protein [Pedobacter chinensis]|uniref:O-antigen ligase family protein n=1 Tax=Pedobacter chinensis TaxID=2282421 RepID=UPI0013147986|nr:O-antigen ligase family protein [Pedobacter chinensis]
MITLLCGLKNEKLGFSLSQADIFVILFATYYLLRSLIDSPSRLNVYDFYFLLCYVLTYGCIKVIATSDKKFLNILIIAILIIFTYEAILTMTQFFGFSKGKNSFFDVSGSFISPALLTNFMCLAFPLLDAYLMEKQQPKLAVLLFVSLSLVCFMTDSKLSWLVLAVLLVFRLVKSSKRQLPSFYFIAAFAALAFIIMAIFLQDSTSGRFLILKGTFSLWHENWFSGIGINQFDRHYNDFQAAHLMANPLSPYRYLASYVQVAYNDFLQIALELGVIGLVFLTYGIILTLSNWRRYPQYLQEAMLMIIIFAMFSFPLQTSSTLILCIIYFGLISTFHTPVSSTNIKTNLIKASFGAAGIILVFLSLKIQNAVMIWKLASRSPIVADHIRFKESVKVFENNKDFQLAFANILYLKKRYSASIAQLNKAALRSSSIDIYLLLAQNYEALGDIALAESNYVKSMTLVPAFLKPKFLLMMLYLKNRRLKDAKGIAGVILSSKIKIKNKESDYILTAAKKISHLQANF